MKHTFTRTEIEGMLKNAGQRSFPGQADRLAQMLAVQDMSEARFDSLALAYYEEARLCWVYGAFVACIVMCQMAFEEAMRAHYWREGDRLLNRKKVNEATFFELTDTAERRGLLSSAEAEDLHRLRKEFRNPYVHPKLVSPSASLVRPDVFRQSLKIFAPDVAEVSVEDEAFAAVALLVRLLPDLSARLF